MEGEDGSGDRILTAQFGRQKVSQISSAARGRQNLAAISTSAKFLQKKKNNNNKNPNFSLATLSLKSPQNHSPSSVLKFKRLRKEKQVSIPISPFQRYVVIKSRTNFFQFCFLFKYFSSEDWNESLRHM